MDRRLTSAVGGFLFFWIAPAVVAGWIPWTITRWRMTAPPLGVPALRWVGGTLVATGATIVVESFARFAWKGLGTPAPIAPTKHLVVSGFYRHVRNPMYLGVLLAILGQALVFASRALIVYAAFVWLAFFLFVVGYEEPSLRARFGASYEAYRAHVPGWWPRLRPWNPP